MSDTEDESVAEEREAREHLIDAEVEAEETLERAERLEEDAPEDDRRNESASD